MVQLKFTLLRFLIDVAFAILLFFGFMCGVHYGCKIIGLYFVFVKFLLGVVGMGIMIFAIRWIKGSALFVLKNSSIYAQCTGCNSVIGSINGIMHDLKDTISVNVLNKLIRESLDGIKDFVSDKAEDSPFVEITKMLSDSRLVKFSSGIVNKALDYVDECILGYCYIHCSEGKSLAKCGVEAFTIFTKQSVKIFKSVFTVLALELLLRCCYWVVFIMYCVKVVPISAMNILLCYVIGVCIKFILEDAIFEPMLMNSVINQFLSFDFKDEDNEMLKNLVSTIPALNKLNSYNKSEEDAINELADDVDEAVSSTEQEAE